MDENKKLDIEILNFLNVVAKDTENGYIWREACGFIKEFERVKNLTIPRVIKREECIEGVKYILKGYQPNGVDYIIPRELDAELKNNTWYPFGCGKRLVNMVIEEIHVL